jgi:dTDP-glucose 4,6-dehydratase
MKALVTGGAGFIGSATCRYLLQELGWQVVIVDSLTYAGQLSSLEDVRVNPSCRFVQIDICDQRAVRECLSAHHPDAVLHLAAETHVDNSIESSEIFVRTNVVGTHRLLEACREYLAALDEDRRNLFRFVHVSTDEVYGSGGAFKETDPARPSSPYAASKAAAEHLVTSWYRTYGLPVLIARCTNNYGPHQLPEKFIPLMILACRENRPLPIYGDGSHTRDWLFVDDHVRGLVQILLRGRVGEAYNIAAQCERSNLLVAQTICDLVDCEIPADAPRRHLISFVADRPGHDRRYALDARKMQKELAWAPQISFESGLERTVQWYLQNDAWWKPILESGVGVRRADLAK